MLNIMIWSNLEIQDFRGQGHDGSSNILGHLADLFALRKNINASDAHT